MARRRCWGLVGGIAVFWYWGWSAKAQEDDAAPREPSAPEGKEPCWIRIRLCAGKGGEHPPAEVVARLVSFKEGVLTVEYPRVPVYVKHRIGELEYLQFLPAGPGLGRSAAALPLALNVAYTLARKQKERGTLEEYLPRLRREFDAAAEYAEKRRCAVLLLGAMLVQSSISLEALRDKPPGHLPELRKVLHDFLSRVTDEKLRQRLGEDLAKALNSRRGRHKLREGPPRRDEEKLPVPRPPQ